MGSIGIEMGWKIICAVVVILLSCIADACPDYYIRQLDTETITEITEYISMTRQQMKNTGKMLKTNCMKKIQVTEDMIGNIQKGQFIEDKKVMCYIACIFEMTNIIKNNKISYETSMKQIDMLYPPEMKEPAKAAATKCKDVQKKYKDICEASFWTAKCIYEFSPEDFVFA